MVKTFTLTAEITADDREVRIIVPEEIPNGRVSLHIMAASENDSVASTFDDLLAPEWPDQADDPVEEIDLPFEFSEKSDGETLSWQEQSGLAFAKEVAAFERMKSELIKEYGGQYVAIYQEGVVGHGEEKGVLLDQVIEQFGEVLCYIEKAEPNTPRRVRIPTVWIVRK